jgi:hypothetical protein
MLTTGHMPGRKIGMLDVQFAMVSRLGTFHSWDARQIWMLIRCGRASGRESVKEATKVMRDDLLMFDMSILN